MPQSRVNSASSVLAILSCDSESLTGFPNSLTEISRRRSLSQMQSAVFNRWSSQDKHRLDELILGMLGAPDPSGARYVAVVLPIATTPMKRGRGRSRGSQSLAGLFAFPESVSAIFLGLAYQFSSQCLPSRSQTLTYDETAVEIASATRSDQGSLRAAVSIVFLCDTVSFRNNGSRLQLGRNMCCH